MQKTLNPEVAAKYVVVAIRPGKYNFKGFGEIDLCALTVSRADELVKRNFPHLKLRQGSADQVTEPGSLKARPINQAKPPVEITEKTLGEMRKNKAFINKLLTLDFKDLTDQDRKIFFDDEKYFLEKKSLLHQVSETDREMKSLHANMKAIAKDDTKQDDRAVIMDTLSKLEEKKLLLFAGIDTWDHTDPLTDPDAIAKKAGEDAIKKQKLIEAHENYIYRNEPLIAKMPEKTAAEKNKKQAKTTELKRRYEELVTLGKPYNRKPRK